MNYSDLMLRKFEYQTFFKNRGTIFLCKVFMFPLKITKIKYLDNDYFNLRNYPTSKVWNLICYL